MGAVGYGGPAILALVRETFVTKKEWITETEFTNAMSLAQALPGANGVNVMGYIGFTIKRVWGGVLAALAFITPPTTLMILLSWAYFTYGQIPVVKSLFAGLGAIVVALLVNAVLVLGKSIFPTITWRHWRGLIVALTSFAGAYFWHFNVLWIVLTAGILGSVLFYFRNGPSPAAIPATALSEDTAVDKEAQPLRAKDLMPVLLIAGIVGVGLFIAATRALVTTFLGIGATAFGGGFGSIPLLQSQVVNAHGWLTNKEFVDGIALGQITPRASVHHRYVHRLPSRWCTRCRHGNACDLPAIADGDHPARRPSRSHSESQSGAVRHQGTTGWFRRADHLRDSATGLGVTPYVAGMADLRSRDHLHHGPQEEHGVGHRYHLDLLLPVHPLAAR